MSAIDVWFERGYSFSFNPGPDPYPFSTWLGIRVQDRIHDTCRHTGKRWIWVPVPYRYQLGSRTVGSCLAELKWRIIVGCYIAKHYPLPMVLIRPDRVSSGGGCSPGANCVSEGRLRYLIGYIRSIGSRSLHCGQKNRVLFSSRYTTKRHATDALLASFYVNSYLQVHNTSPNSEKS